jgi:hypothetical protein
MKGVLVWNAGFRLKYRLLVISSKDLAMGVLVLSFSRYIEVPNVNAIQMRFSPFPVTLRSCLKDILDLCVILLLMVVLKSA